MTTKPEPVSNMSEYDWALVNFRLAGAEHRSATNISSLGIGIAGVVLMNSADSRDLPWILVIPAYLICCYFFHRYMTKSTRDALEKARKRLDAYE